MNYKILFMVIFLFFPTLSFSQEDQKELLSRAVSWIDTNIQCTEFIDGDPGGTAQPSLGKCSQVEDMKPIFCHLFSPSSTQLILSAEGTSGRRVGGWWEVDQKYIMFTIYNGLLFADVFFENGGGVIKIIQLHDKPDLILVKDASIYGGDPVGANLFAGTAKKMRTVLNYEAEAMGHQTPAGFETLLIPIDQNGFRLLKLETFSDDAIHVKDMKVSESFYKFDLKSQAYQLSGPTKEIPFIEGIVDWWENWDRLKEGYLDKDFEVFIKENNDDLRQVIQCLKLPPTNHRRVYAHKILADIAGKDLGEDYKAWKKWEKENNARSGQL